MKCIVFAQCVHPATLSPQLPLPAAAPPPFHFFVLLIHIQLITFWHDLAMPSPTHTHVSLRLPSPRPQPSKCGNI